MAPKLSRRTPMGPKARMACSFTQTKLVILGGRPRISGKPDEELNPAISPSRPTSEFLSQYAHLRSARFHIARFVPKPLRLGLVCARLLHFALLRQCHREVLMRLGVSGVGARDGAKLSFGVLEPACLGKGDPKGHADAGIGRSESKRRLVVWERVGNAAQVRQRVTQSALCVGEVGPALNGFAEIRSGRLVLALSELKEPKPKVHFAAV